MTVPAATRSGMGSAKAFAGVTAALAMFGAAQGLTAPLFTLLMQKQGFSPGAIGLSAAMMPVGWVVSASLVPPAVALIGARGLGVAAAALAAVVFVLIGWLQDWVAWFPLRFLLGFIVNPLYILGEVWALALADPARRGRIMGVFNTVMGCGFAVGPLMLALVGTEGWAAFSVGIAGFCACAAVLAVVAKDLAGFQAEAGENNVGVLRFARMAPTLIVAVGVSAAVQQSTYALMPVFGTAYGLGEATLAALITALSVGNIVLQIPLGLAAERFGARTMIVACTLTTMVCALLLPLVITSLAVWPVLVLMGGVGYGVYTMSLVELGDRFSGTMLVAGNSAFALNWGLGGIVGPPSAGFIIGVVGPGGFPALLAVMCGGLAAFALYRAAGRRS